MNKNCRAYLLACLACLATSPSIAADDTAPRLKTHQSYIEDLMREAPLDIADPLAVFGYVFASLAERVKVYPTENYYYFSFIHRGVTYHGNIRLDASDRDAGFVNFGYFEEYALWRAGAEVTYRHLSAKEGVKVEKLARLSYRVSFNGKSIVFDLNDLSGVKPPEGMLNANETYIGPVFDESGMQFFLVFNKDAKVFHYILNEKVKNPEIFEQAKNFPNVTIGRRTSFAFYKDKRERQILVGVHESNSFLNNYYDGPFDQLPDNFLEGDVLKTAIATVLPDYADKIDRFGAVSNSDRYAISPYMYYATEGDLGYFDDCINDKSQPEAAYYQCFNAEAFNNRNADGVADDITPDSSPSAAGGDTK
ncbi:MAG: hypothetical protein SGJ17_10560 [Hyphomicrobiales bacterium]|nr:hypothetical protein [Hyphomicrobiales bacterium]